MNKKTWIVLIIIYLFSLVIWAIPIFQAKVPFGGSDISIHYYLSTYMANTDKSLLDLPPSASAWYLYDPKENPQNHLMYPPPLHTSLSLAQLVTFDTYYGFYFLLLVYGTIGMFTIFLLCRELFGDIAALLSAFLFPFLLRNSLSYLWGQFATCISYSLVPLILLLYYKYINSGTPGNKEFKWLAIMSAMVCLQFTIHPIGAMMSFMSVVVYTIFLTIKDKALPISIKHGILTGVIICLGLVFLQLTHADILQNRASEFDVSAEGFGFSFSRLFGWYNMPGGYHGIPAFYFSFDKIYNGWWLLVPVLLGLVLLSIRRSKKDWVILSTLIAFYILTHLDLMGMNMGGYFQRQMYYESILFIPLISVGVVYFFRTFSQKYKSAVMWASIILFIGIFCYINVLPSINLFQNTFSPQSRITFPLIDAANFINNNVPQGSYVLLIGTPTFEYQTWLQALTPGIGLIFDQGQLVPTKDTNLGKEKYVLFDFSWQRPNEEVVSHLLSLEQSISNSSTKIYDSNVIKVYKLG